VRGVSGNDKGKLCFFFFLFPENSACALFRSLDTSPPEKGADYTLIETIASERYSDRRREATPGAVTTKITTKV
jgi:hypothetical protein